MTERFPWWFVGWVLLPAVLWVIIILMARFCPEILFAGLTASAIYLMFTSR